MFIVPRSMTDMELVPLYVRSNPVSRRGSGEEGEAGGVWMADCEVDLYSAEAGWLS